MMSRRERQAASAGPQVTADCLRQGVEGLMGALDEGGDYLPQEQAAAARAVLSKAAERLGFSGAHTVVALAGATGSGKSSLFNRLIGQEITRSGELRPTTTHITAGVWGRDEAGPLLDWLQVKARHQVEAGRRERADSELNLDGLVLLDLPDFDSDVAAHRAEADRVLALADVFVWVTDPQKYADAVLHDRYLAAARDHQTVTLVLMNQADRMRSDMAQACLNDLRRLLQEDGLPAAEVLLVSARTGQGLAELASALSGAAKAATAARVRLLGDVRREAATLRGHVADDEPTLPEHLDAELISALGRASGVPVVLDSVERDYRRRAALRTGWPFGRWLQRFRPDPLARVGLSGGRGRSGEPEPQGDSDVGELLHRSSLPQAPPAARAAVDLATRRLAESAAQGLPDAWADAVERAALPNREDLADALDQAIVTTPIRTPRPAWWTVFNVLQWVSAVAVLGGLAWVLGMTFLQLPYPPEQRLGAVPIPVLLVLAGLLLGLLLTVLAHPLVRAGARRRRAMVERHLGEQIDDVARARLLDPVRELLARHAQTRRHLEAALGR